MNLSLILAFLKCRSAAKANHLSGWVGMLFSAGAGYLVYSGHLQAAVDKVCATPDAMGLVVFAAGTLASFSNSGATKILAPKEDQKTTALDGGKKKKTFLGFDVESKYPE